MVYSPEYDDVLDGPPCLSFNIDDSKVFAKSKSSAGAVTGKSTAVPGSTAKQRRYSTDKPGIQRKPLKSDKSSGKVGAPTTKMTNQTKQQLLNPAQIHTQQQKRVKPQLQQHLQLPTISEKSERIYSPTPSPNQQLNQQKSSTDGEVPVFFKLLGGVYDRAKQIFTQPEVTAVQPDFKTIQQANTPIPGQYSPAVDKFHHTIPPAYPQTPTGPQVMPTAFHPQEPQGLQTLFSNVPGAAGPPLGTPLMDGLYQGQGPMFYSPGPNYAQPMPPPALGPQQFQQQPQQHHLNQNGLPPGHREMPTPEQVGFFLGQNSTYLDYQKAYEQMMEQHQQRIDQDYGSVYSHAHVEQPEESVFSLVKSASTPILVLCASGLALTLTSATEPSANVLQQMAGYLNTFVRSSSLAGAGISLAILAYKYSSLGKPEGNSKDKFIAGQSFMDPNDPLFYQHSQEGPVPYMNPQQPQFPPNEVIHEFYGHPHFVPLQQNVPLMNVIPPGNVNPTPLMNPVTPQFIPDQISRLLNGTPIPMTPQVQFTTAPPTAPAAATSNKRVSSGSTLQVPSRAPSAKPQGTPNIQPAAGQLFPGLLVTPQVGSEKPPMQMNDYLASIGVAAGMKTPIPQAKDAAPTPNINVAAIPGAMPIQVPLQVPTPSPMPVISAAQNPTPIPAPVSGPMLAPQIIQEAPKMPKSPVDAISSNKGYVKHFSFIPAGTMLDDMKVHEDEKIDPSNLRYFDLAGGKLSDDLMAELKLRRSGGNLLMPPLPNIDDPRLTHSIPSNLEGTYPIFPLEMELEKENYEWMAQTPPPLDYKKLYKTFEAQLDEVSMRPADAKAKKGKSEAEKTDDKIKSILKNGDKTKSAKGAEHIVIDDYYVDDFSCKPYGPPPKRYRALRV